LTTRVPARIGCSCTVAPDAASSRFLLWAEGIESPAVVEVDGRTCGWIDRLHPVIDLGDLIAPGRAARLTLAPQKWYAAEALGRIFFAQGMALERWEIARAEEPELLASAAAHDARARPARLPVELAPGAMAWLSGIVRPVTAGGYVLTLGGANLKATVFLDETLVGRIFLPSPARPAMAGGRDDCAWLPPCWLAGKEPAVRILLESIGPGPGRLDAIAADPAP
jgi:beta-galactosidase